MDGQVDIEEPLALCRKVFKCKNVGDLDLSDQSFPELVDTVPMDVYHNVMRNKFLDVLKVLGLETTTSHSIDSDEIFMKVWLNRSGELIKALAEQQRYFQSYTLLSRSATFLHSTWP